MTAILPVSKCSCLLLHIVLKDALSEVTKVCPPLNLKVLWMTSQPSWKAKQGVGKKRRRGFEVGTKRGRREGFQVVDHRRRERREE